MIRQPVFYIGEEVRFIEKFTSTDERIKRDVELRGIVAGVSYDPVCVTQGWPFYEYKILVERSIFKKYEREIYK